MSTSSSSVTDGMPDFFFASLTHSPSWRVWCSASQRSNASPSGKPTISTPPSSSMRPG
ncbi:hypothetical protein [Streptomyces sp. NPDC091027]|uniref:hypothetical protein n=1 Tax=Streptomyces sp. NPDC091027 TaxID=3365971 RepID=UPI00381E11C7